MLQSGWLNLTPWSAGMQGGSTTHRRARQLQQTYGPLAPQTPTATAPSRLVNTPLGYWNNPGSATAAVPKTPNTSHIRSPGHDFFGALTVGLGVLGTMAGAYYSAEANRYRAEDAQIQAELAAELASQDARALEFEASSILESGADDIGRRTIAAGQEKAETRSRIAGRGILTGVGSAAEVLTGIDIAKEIDVMTIDSNARRAASAARIEAARARGRGIMATASAENAGRSADAIDPAASAFVAGTASLTDIVSRSILARRFR